MKDLEEYLISLSHSQQSRKMFEKEILRRTQKPVTEAFFVKLRHYILLTPKLIERIRIYWEMEKEAANRKKIGTTLLSYLYHPAEYSSLSQQELFDYLDDAYLISLIFEKTIEDRIDSDKTIAEKDREYLEQITIMKPCVSMILSKENKKIALLADRIYHKQMNQTLAVIDHSA